MTVFSDMQLTTDTKSQVFNIRERGAFSGTIKRARVPIQEVKLDLQVPEVKYVCCLTSSMFDEYMAPVFNENKPCAFDIETAPSDKWRDEPMASLDSRRSDITGISFSHTLGTAIYIPLRHRSGKNFELDPGVFVNWLKTEFFERTDIIKIAHNISFESAFMYKHGIVIQEPVYDTIAASQLTLKNDKAFRDLGDSGLKKLSLEILGIKQTEFADVTQGRFFDELNPQNYATVEYACADSDHTIRLYQYFEEWFRLNIPRHSFYCLKIDSPACVYAGLMKYNGIGVNKDLMLAKKAEAESKLEALRTEIDKYTGGIDIGKNAATDVFKKWLFNTQGFHVPHRTEKGRDSIDDESFQVLMDECRESRPEMLPMFERLQEYRKWGKLLSTYIDGYMQYINPETGRIHADLMPTVTDTSRFASRKPNLQNCFDNKTEILTKRGWMFFEHLLPEDEVAQWDQGIITFVLPTSIIKQSYEGDLVLLRSQHINLCVTPDHRCLLFNRKTQQEKVLLAHQYTNDYRQLHAGTYAFGKMNFSKELCILICATQADAHYHDNGLAFSFAKKRKTERLLWAIEKLKIPYSLGERRTKDYVGNRIRVKKSPLVAAIMSLLGEKKVFGDWILNVSKQTAEYLIKEIVFWDGCWARKNVYSSSIKENSDWIQILYTLSDIRAKQRAYHNGNPRSIINYQLDTTYRNYSLTTNVDKALVPYKGCVYCVEVPSSYIVVRREGRTAITGNCPRKDNDPIGIRNFFIADQGNSFLDFDFSQIELRVGAVYCRDEKMLEVYRNNGDIHAQTTAALYNISLEQAKDKDAENYKERRTIAKNMNFGIFFGLYSKGLQRTLKFKAGIEKTQDACEEYINNLRRGYPGIFRWQEDTKKHAREYKFSETAFGFRRILKEIDSNNWGTKAFWERAALNTPVQGTAAGIIKLAMARLLKIFKVYPQLRPILQIHDELLFECPEQETDTAAGYVKACMEVQPYAEFDVPIKAEGAAGKLFGELKEL